MLNNFYNILKLSPTLTRFTLSKKTCETNFTGSFYFFYWNYYFNT